MIILEDMHWADDSSLQLLQACAGLPGLMVAVTFRGPEAFDKLREPVAAMRAIPGTTSLMLHPWTSVEVAEVARHVDRSWVPLLVDGSGGIPLVVGEMLRALEEAGSGRPASWPLGVPARLADIVSYRIEGLSESSAAAVLAVYVLNEPASPMQIARLAGLDPALVHEALTQGAESVKSNETLRSVCCELNGGPAPAGPPPQLEPGRAGAPVSHWPASVSCADPRPTEPDKTAVEMGLW